VNRRRRPHRWIGQLALLATLLMVLAPLVSRVLQPHAAPALEQGPHSHHAGAATAPASAPADPHALHGEACEYCVLATRLLPWLAACLLLLARLVWRPRPHCHRASPTPAGLSWPAHGARGPPMLHVLR